ncbi:MAG: right-handed parallel beta-helix repeat-containing protein [Candidatus Heimdallarchaeota archaeon]|nr:right-handed parallel beta-helix repeat-containing protein [Candidatus Heimdallarchaeota archaeon]
MLGKNLFGRFLVLILICTSFSLSINTGNDKKAFVTSSPSDEIPLIVTEDYDAPIYIDEDSDFDSYGFPGNGLQSNPYIIENKHFMSVEYLNGIEIHNTTKHFLIRDCSFDNMDYGILIVRVANHTATVAYNEFQNDFSAAISIHETHHALIENNTGRLNHGGIGIHDCTHILISNNNFYGGISLGRITVGGIFVMRSNHSIIRNNSLNNFNQGIHVWKSFNCLIEENTIVNMRFLDSIYLKDSTNNVIKNNFIYNNLYGDGIECDQSSENLFINNTIYHCADAGIRLAFQSYNNTIYHNNFINNTRGSFQGYDNGGADNLWYNESIGEGNYWSDWEGVGPYFLGTMNNDSYPLDDLIGINENDLFVPITYYDDHLEENDFIQDAPTLLITQKHELHYADIDIYKIPLTEGVLYYFSLNFNIETINLDFFLIIESYLGVFNVLIGSETIDETKTFIFSATFTGDYYLIVVGDLKHYTTIVPSYYQLKYYTEIASLSRIYAPIIWLWVLLVFTFILKKKKK